MNQDSLGRPLQRVEKIGRLLENAAGNLRGFNVPTMFQDPGVPPFACNPQAIGVITGLPLRSGTTFGVLVFPRRRRRSPLSLRPPATVCQPFGLKKGELRFMGMINHEGPPANEPERPRPFPWSKSQEHYLP